VREADLSKKLPDGSVQCLACSWGCKIKNGQTGICGVRKNIDGKLYLLVSGKAIAAHVDPVEKKPLYHFLPGTDIFSFGTVGCNFGCRFCQNWDISQITRNKKLKSKTLLGEEDFNLQGYGYEMEPEEIVKYCEKNSIRSIAFTYNEPTIFAEYAKDVMKVAKDQERSVKDGNGGDSRAKEVEIKGVFVSNGFETEETLDYLEDYIDAYNIDIKGFTDEFYQKVCKAKLQPVLDTVKSIYKRGKWMELTTLLIPTENDSDDEIREIAEFIAGVSPEIPWHISAFHPDYKMLDKTITKDETLFRAEKIGKRAGLKFIYTGNIASDKFSNTTCPKCGVILIERHGFSTKILDLKNGKCTNCQTKIPGVWK
jgi:pyruvate formate lyase activating enzyme